MWIYHLRRSPSHIRNIFLIFFIALPGHFTSICVVSAILFKAMDDISFLVLLKMEFITFFSVYFVYYDI